MCGNVCVSNTFETNFHLCCKWYILCLCVYSCRISHLNNLFLEYLVLGLEQTIRKQYTDKYMQMTAKQLSSYCIIGSNHNQNDHTKIYIFVSKSFHKINYPFISNDDQKLHCVEYVMIYLPVHAPKKLLFLECSFVMKNSLHNVHLHPLKDYLQCTKTIWDRLIT